MSCIFTNDNHSEILLIEHPLSKIFASRDNHEVLFRRIHTYLINTGIIKNNIIDLGAWIGDNTIPWAKSIEAKSIEAKSIEAKSIEAKSIDKKSIDKKSIETIYAMDPSPDNCEFIRQMCHKNQVSNVKVFQTAVSNCCETLSTNDDMYHCTFAADESGRNKVDAVSLDHLFLINEITNIGYIHLDVEGMEYKVLLGSKKIIETYKPIITFEQHLEIDDYNLILNYLTELNYTVYLIDEVLPGCRADCRNSIAFPAEIMNPKIVADIHAYIGKEILLPFF
jgi:FkbM family methyltransferase